MEEIDFQLAIKKIQQALKKRSGIPQ